MKRIRKIVLCGASSIEQTNFGDVLLETLLIEKLKKIIPDVSISKFERYDSIKNIAWKILKTDIFIYVPGGYMGYIEKWYSGSFKKTIERFVYYYLPGLIYKMTRKPILMLGQGIGPYEYRALGLCLKKISNYSSLITVRDTESYSLLRKVGCTNKIQITADCSQVLKDYNFIFDCTETKEIRRRKTNKVMFVLYFNSEKWKNLIIQALEPLMKEDYCFVISTDGINTDRKDFMDFVKYFPSRKTIAFDYKSPEQLLSVLNEVDIVVTPKLHTGIVSCVLGKSVFAFACQYNKTRIYYIRIGYPERVQDLDKITSKEMRNIIIKYQDEKITVPEEVITAASDNYRILCDFIKSINQENKLD